MGHPKGETVEQVQERNREQHHVTDTATCIVADAIERALRDTAALRREYGISEVDLPAVLKRVRAIRQRLDPYGDWKQS